MTPEVFAHLVGPPAHAPDAPWLLVGARARTAPGGVAARWVEDVHAAVEVLDRVTVAGILVDADALLDRPMEALQTLRRQVEPGAPMAVFGPAEGRHATRKAAATLGIPWHDETLAGVAPPEGGHAQPTRPPARDLPNPNGERKGTSLPDPDLASRLLAHLDQPRRLRRLVLDRLRKGAGAGRASLFLRHGRPARLRMVAGVGHTARLVGRVRVGLRGGLLGRAARTRRPLLGRGDVGGEREYQGDAFVILPLVTQHRVEGLVCLTDLTGNELPDASTLHAWQAAATQCAQALRNASRLRRAERLSSRDRLTGLPNRRAFERALERELTRAERLRTWIAVAILDVDHFKALNDRHGHAAGDRALREVGRRLAATLRTSDLVARWGGEEFALLLPDGAPEREDEIRDAVDRAREAVAARPIPLGPSLPAVTVQISGGVAFGPRVGQDEASLLRAADAALYRAKEGGRNRIQVAPNVDPSPDGGSPADR